MFGIEDGGMVKLFHRLFYRGGVNMEKLESIEQFKEVLEEHETFYLLKHSLTCPISQAAYEEYEEHGNKDTNMHYYLAVQDARPLSNYIAETYHVKHESPQAILFNKGNVAWHASHWKVTKKSLQQAKEENEIE